MAKSANLRDSEPTSNEPRKRIGLVMHSVYNAKFFLVPHIHMLAEKYDVILFVRNDAPDILKSMNLPVQIVEVPIERHISIFNDLKALIVLTFLFLRHKPDLIHTMTAKAGLLGIIAAFISRVPRRLHTFQGEVWPHFSGFKRSFFRFLDWLVVRLATDITVVSKSEMEFLRNEHVLTETKGVVLGEGSICGVDLTRFVPNEALRRRMRTKLGYAEDDFVFLYLGRLQRDKGLDVMSEAFNSLAKQTDHSVKLLVVGPDEDDIGQRLQKTLGADVQILPYTDRPEDFIACGDTLILPSFREGFGMVLIEAAAMGVPAVASRIYGISSAVEDGVSGLLFEVGNAASMANIMAQMINDPAMYQKMSEDARARCVTHFDQKIVLNNFDLYYGNLLS